MMKMSDEYKICNGCGKKVNVNANFCPSCKSQSFRTEAVVVRKSNEPVSFTHKLLYWDYNGEFVLSKSKLAGICVFVFCFITGLSLSAAMWSVIPVGVIFGLLVYFLGFALHQIRGKPKEAVISFNDYGVVRDIGHLLFFWQNKNTGEYVPAKTKIISFLFFVLIALVTTQLPNPALFVSIAVAAIFTAPVFLVGCGIHKLTNPNPTNPKKIPPKKESEKIPKKEKPKVERKIRKQPKEPEEIPKFVEYENQIEDLKVEYKAKEKVARELIEKRFAPPQITYTRFISIVDKATEVFDKEAESSLNILHLATEESPRIDREIEAKIGIMNSIIDKIDDLTNELIISMDSSKEEDAKILIDDMEDLISSVKDYDEIDDS